MDFIGILLLIVSSSAIIYSVVETAKENGLNPFIYLTYLFETLPNIDIEENTYYFTNI